MSFSCILCMLLHKNAFIKKTYKNNKKVTFHPNLKQGAVFCACNPSLPRPLFYQLRQPA